MKDPESWEPDRRIQLWGRICISLIMIGFLATTFRIGQLKLDPPSELIPHLGARRSTIEEVGRRGRIFDRQYRLLAYSSRGYRLFADPAIVWERAWDPVKKRVQAGLDAGQEPNPFGEIAENVGPILGIQQQEIFKRLSSHADSRYVVLAQQIDDEAASRINQKKMIGLGMQERLIRHYPYGDLAAGIIGCVGFDPDRPTGFHERGASGIEYKRNEALLATSGTLSFQRDVRRQPLFIDKGSYEPASNGMDVFLTIDAVIQSHTEQILQRTVDESNATGGMALVLDVESGDILAMTDVLVERSKQRTLTSDPARLQNRRLSRNRCVTDSFEPGSTFKAFIWSAAVSEGVVTPEEMIPTPASGQGPLVIRKGRGVRRIRDFRDRYYGSVEFNEVLRRSLNTGMALVADRLTAEQMQNSILDFGFNQSTNCGLSGESAGQMTAKNQWNPTATHFSVAFGQEIAVTTVQMARAFAALCNDGLLQQIQIVKPVSPSEGPHYLPTTRRAVTSQSARKTREALYQVMESGTGKRARSDLYRMFGKTGTAQIAKKGGGGYYQDRVLANFIAAAPLQQPRIVVYIVIEDPDKSRVPNRYTGGSLAGPAGREIMEHALMYLGVPFDRESAQEHDLQSQWAAAELSQPASD